MRGTLALFFQSTQTTGEHVALKFRNFAETSDGVDAIPAKSFTPQPGQEGFVPTSVKTWVKTHRDEFKRPGHFSRSVRLAPINCNRRHEVIACATGGHTHGHCHWSAFGAAVAATESVPSDIAWRMHFLPKT